MFLDTSGLLCLLDAREKAHVEANEYFNLAGISRITHSYVLAELVALMYARGIPRLKSLNLAVGVAENPDIELVWVDELLNKEALNLLLHRLDKAYSLCDAVSFVLMRERGIVDALTTDHHFEQEGFRRLLK